MRHALLIIAAFVTLAAGLARADLPKGAIAPDIEAKEWINTDGEKVSLSDYRGMVVTLFFWVSFHKGGENMMYLINLVENSRGLGRSRGVMTIGLTDADLKRTQEVISKEKITFPVGVESPTAKEYELGSFPRVVVIDAEGKVFWSGWPGGGGDELAKAITDALAATPPTRTHPVLAKQARSELAKAREALRQGQYRAAFEAARDANEAALTGDPLKTTCQDMLDLLEALGRDKLAEADEFVDNQKWEDAVRTFRLVQRQFRSMDVAKTAQERLDALAKSNPEIGNIVKAQHSSAKAKGELKKATDALEARRFGEAYETLLQIQKDYPDSEEADSAAAIIARMEAKPEIVAAVREKLAERDCKAWIARAKTLASARRYDEARTWLRKVLDAYPDTQFAKEAAAELVKLP